MVPVLLPLLSTAGPVEQTPEEKGLAIALEADRRDSGFEDYTAELSMVSIEQSRDHARGVVCPFMWLRFEEGGRSPHCADWVLKAWFDSSLLGSAPQRTFPH